MIVLAPTRLLAAALAFAAFALPSLAGAERVVTRNGEVFVGSPRFEEDAVVVVREDGTEVRLRRADVERIELSEEEAVPEVAPPGGTPEGQAVEPPPEQAPPAPRGPPRWRPRNLPPPPSGPPPYYAPYAPPPPQPIYRERAYDQNGVALAIGYHRGLAVGGEYQFHTAKHVTLGVGAQLGLESAPQHDEFDDGRETESYGTFGFTGRAYVGRAHRLALEAGFGLNAIDPDLEETCGLDETDCAVRNYGPEFSAGYQFLSDRGFLFETLFGFGVITNERYRNAHAAVNPLFQLSFGYLFH